MTIHLDAGEDVTCTFVNDPTTALTRRHGDADEDADHHHPGLTATPTKTPVATVGPVKPPSAGDGGLLSQGNGVPWFLGMLGMVAAAGTAWLFLQQQMKRSRRN